MTDRRKVLSVLLGGFGQALIASRPAFAQQQQTKTIRVGILVSGSTSQWAFAENALVDGLREHGYVEGRNLVLVRRSGELQGDRIRQLAAEMGTMNLDAIVTSCTGTTRAVSGAAPDTPIVMGSVADPVGAGLVKSLARPGTRITGRSTQSSELMPKRLELLRSIVPDATRIAVLVNGLNPVHEMQWRETESAAQALNVQLVRIDTRGAAGFDAALASLGSAGARALFLLEDDPVFVEHRQRIAGAAAQLKLATIGSSAWFVEGGALMSYGSDSGENWRRSAAHVVKVANGANPAELPVEQPVDLRLVLNTGVAKALGISFPRAVLLRADRLIE